MPGIRLPFSLHRRALPNEAVALPLGADAATPPPLLTHDDPRLQAFLSVTFDALYDLDVRSGALSFSEQIDEMLGLPSGGFPRTLPGWLQCLHPDDRDETEAAVWRSLAERQPLRCEYRLRHGDGHYRTIDDQGVVLVAADGEPSNLIGAMRDATAEREAELAERDATELHRLQGSSPARPAPCAARRPSWMSATPPCACCSNSASRTAASSNNAS
jgi:PAS domain S-box-containing protein